MRPGLVVGVAAGIVSTLLAACGAQLAPTQAVVPIAATQDALQRFYGSYSTDDGDIVVVARLGWFADLRDGTYRTIYEAGTAGHFTIGWRFEEPLPKFADLLFGSDQLEITMPTHRRLAHRIGYRQTDVTIPAAGAQLSGTITEPQGAGPHPGDPRRPRCGAWAALLL